MKKQINSYYSTHTYTHMCVRAGRRGGGEGGGQANRTYSFGNEENENMCKDK